MIGALIGDIVGSRFEFNNHRSKDFELFTPECKVTDDSIMTLAIGKALVEARKEGLLPSTQADSMQTYTRIQKLAVHYMQKIGRKYPDCGYGGLFQHWMFNENPNPYNSYGNGGAMRISPVGDWAKSEEEVKFLSKAVTAVTHNHPEGIKGAEAVALVIWMARQGYTKREIRDKVEAAYYPLNFTIAGIRDTYRFNETSQETVPQAIQAFLESRSFEDAIRTAISLGGDSDTLAAITGSIAEAYYGVPNELVEQALGYLDSNLRSLFDEFHPYAGTKTTGAKFRVMTKYIPRFSQDENIGHWVVDTGNGGNRESPRYFPFVNYSRLVHEFLIEFFAFSDNHPEYDLHNYLDIMENNGLKWEKESMSEANVAELDAQTILALLAGASRAERFTDGALLWFFEDGSILQWLRRLEEIDYEQMEQGT